MRQYKANCKKLHRFRVPCDWRIKRAENVPDRPTQRQKKNQFFFCFFVFFLFCFFFIRLNSDCGALVVVDGDDDAEDDDVTVAAFDCGDDVVDDVVDAGALDLPLLSASPTPLIDEPRKKKRSK
jgi:hypothetical protein